MKSLLALALLLITPIALKADTITTTDSVGDAITVVTSATGITVTPQYYQAKQTQPGKYTIGGVVGKVPFVNTKVGNANAFTINDPALTKAIINKSAQIVLTFETETMYAKSPGNVTLALP